MLSQYFCSLKLTIFSLVMNWEKRYFIYYVNLKRKKYFFINTKIFHNVVNAFLERFLLNY